MQHLERPDLDRLQSDPNSQTVHPLIELMRERMQTQSQRGERSDGRTLALAIEGGGSAGVISAGMCVALEKTGLIDTVDLIYGTSSGALNGSYTAAGQAAVGATNYEDTANWRFTNLGRMLGKRPVIDFDFLFDDVIRIKRPYNVSGLEKGPEFRAVGVNLDTHKQEVMKNFSDVEDMMKAVRASCTVPFISGPAALYRGKRIADGALVASVPYQAALEEGATDVLVLRTRPASRRKGPYPQALIKLIRRSDPTIAQLIEARPRLYNKDADFLESQSLKMGVILQIAPPNDMKKVSQLEHSRDNVRKGLAIGMAAATKAFKLSE
jgi:predicted patatin/cPLA2 family phospholipase